MFWQRKYPARNKRGMWQGVTVKNLKMMTFSSMAMCVCVARFSKVFKYPQYVTASMPTSVDASVRLMISAC